MRLLVDEDVASRELLGRLEATLPGMILAPERGVSDDDVWSRAQAEGAAILTANGVDFLRLAADRPQHHGLLLVFRVNDPTRDLRAIATAARVAAIVARYPEGLDGLTLVVNNFPGLEEAR